MQELDSESGFGTGVLGTEKKKAFAILIENKLSQNSIMILNEVKFKTLNFKKSKADIYLCLYENDKGLPGKIVENGQILLHVAVKKATTNLNLSSLNIKIPTIGYFIGFEWILSKENEISGAFKTSNPPYNPTIEGVAGEDVNLYVFDGETWKKEKDEFVSALKLDITYLTKK